MAALRWRSAIASARALPGAQACWREEENKASTGVVEKAMRGLGAAMYSQLGTARQAEVVVMLTGLAAQCGGVTG